MLTQPWVAGGSELLWDAPPAGAQSLGARQEERPLKPLLDIYERDALTFIVVV